MCPGESSDGGLSCAGADSAAGGAGHPQGGGARRGQPVKRGACGCVRCANAGMKHCFIQPRRAYNLHPTLHPAPGTRHPAPCTLHPAPYCVDAHRKAAHPSLRASVGHSEGGRSGRGEQVKESGCSFIRCGGIKYRFMRGRRIVRGNKALFHPTLLQGQAIPQGGVRVVEK